VIHSNTDQGTGAGGRNVYPIFQDPTGAVWVGAWTSGLSRFRDGVFANYTTANGLPDGLATAIGEDSKHDLWVGTRGGVAVLSAIRFRKPKAYPSWMERLCRQSFRIAMGSFGSAPPTDLFRMQMERLDGSPETTGSPQTMCV
jgi:hypothetical protein